MLFLGDDRGHDPARGPDAVPGDDRPADGGQRPRVLPTIMKNSPYE